MIKKKTVDEVIIKRTDFGNSHVNLIIFMILKKKKNLVVIFVLETNLNKFEKKKMMHGSFLSKSKYVREVPCNRLG
jgi:hypothetical protein